MQSKPCLILRSPLPPHRYCAWNEDGRLIAHRTNYFALQLEVSFKDYAPVPANSRLGRTILDKMAFLNVRNHR